MARRRPPRCPCRGRCATCSTAPPARLGEVGGVGRATSGRRSTADASLGVGQAQEPPAAVIGRAEDSLAVLRRAARRSSSPRPSAEGCPCRPARPRGRRRHRAWAWARRSARPSPRWSTTWRSRCRGDLGAARGTREVAGHRHDDRPARGAMARSSRVSSSAAAASSAATLVAGRRSDAGLGQAGRPAPWPRPRGVVGARHRRTFAKSLDDARGALDRARHLALRAGGAAVVGDVDLADGPAGLGGAQHQLERVAEPAVLDPELQQVVAPADPHRARGRGCRTRCGGG